MDTVNDATRLLFITVLGLVAMIGAIFGLQRSAGLRTGLQPMVAALRAVIQLAGLALVLQGVFTYPWLAVAMLAVMMTVASLTSGRRLKGLPFGRRAAAVGIVVTASTTIAIIFTLQLMPLTVSNFIAIGGIITGNSMSAATLTGRRFLASSQTQRGEIEAWFALGARPRHAFAQVSRTAIEEMLLPTIDQTKSTGLVTMPGAFVGALIGGAPPVEAARFQVVVLVAIMLAQTFCGIIVTRILSRATVIASEQGPVAVTGSDADDISRTSSTDEDDAAPGKKDKEIANTDEAFLDAQAELERRARRHTTT